MMIKDLASLPKKKIEEKITNRILINFAYIIIGYVLLYMFYQYGMGRFGNILTYRYVMCGLLVVSAAATALLYALSFSKSPKYEKLVSSFRNYGHMMLAVSFALFYVNLPFYTLWMPIETAPAAVRSVLMFIKNTRYEYYVIAILMLVYLVFTIIYHSAVLRKMVKASKAKTSKSK